MKEIFRGFSFRLVALVTISIVVAAMYERVNPDKSVAIADSYFSESFRGYYGGGYVPATPVELPEEIVFETVQPEPQPVPEPEPEPAPEPAPEPEPDPQPKTVFKTEIESVEFEEPFPENLTKKYFQMEKGPHIVQLQMDLGMRWVDGVYGPMTRKAHVAAIGGNEKATRMWMNDRQWQWMIDNPEKEAAMDKNLHYEDPPTLEQYVHWYFLEEDWEWALAVAACESSAKPTDTYNTAVSWAHAKGAFQHLHKYWDLRRSLAGFEGFDIFDLEANTGVASWLFYTSGPQHWNPSKHCWSKKVQTY